MASPGGVKSTFLAVAFALAGGILTLMTGPDVHAQQGDGFHVIVNASNPIGQMARGQVGSPFRADLGSIVTLKPVLRT